MSFQPDYRNIVQAARNETPARIPLYDHKVGDGIGNFGGVDTDHLVRTEDEELVKIVRDVYEHCKTGHGGVAIGSGNSIPDYVDVNKYVLMTRTVRECRGDKL